MLSSIRVQPLEKMEHRSNKIIDRGREYEFNIPSRNVRDSIIQTLEKNFKDDPHLSDLVTHFAQFDPKCLDKYSDFIVFLKLYSTKLKFVTTRMEYSGIEYMIDAWKGLPPEDFMKRKKFLGIF